jgi:photosystem II PsbU protein
MKRLLAIATALLIIVGSWGFVGATQAQAGDLNLFTVQSTPILAVRRNIADDKRLELERGKLDLNNSDVREFRQLRGFYPNLASKIIQNAPYKKVEDVLSIPGLSEGQKERLQANLDKFIVTDVNASMNEGGDRYNPGLY